MLLTAQKFEFTVKHSEDMRYSDCSKLMVVSTVCELYMCVCDWGSVERNNIRCRVVFFFLPRNLQHGLEESCIKTHSHLPGKHTNYQWRKCNSHQDHELRLLLPTNLIYVCVRVCVCVCVIRALIVKFHPLWFGNTHVKRELSLSLSNTPLLLSLTDILMHLPTVHLHTCCHACCLITRL